MAVRHELIETLIAIPPQGWSIGHVTIQGRSDSDKAPIEALRRGAFAVHEVYSLDGKGWRVSHAPTGLQIWTFDSMDEAILLVESIESFTDWHSISKMLPYGTELYPKVRAEIDRIKQGD